MPIIAVPTAPIPVQIAYAVPMGIARKANAKHTILTLNAATVPTLGHSRVNPSEYQSPTTQTTSNPPATNKYTHPITPSFPKRAKEVL